MPAVKRVLLLKYQFILLQFELITKSISQGRPYIIVVFWFVWFVCKAIFWIPFQPNK